MAKKDDVFIIYNGERYFKEAKVDEATEGISKEALEEAKTDAEVVSDNDKIIKMLEEALELLKRDKK